MSEIPTVHARIEIQLELQTGTVSGAQLDLMGLSSIIRDYLNTFPAVQEGQIKLVDISSSTKDWEIDSQIRFQRDRSMIR